MSKEYAGGADERMSHMEIARRAKTVIDQLRADLPEGILDCALSDEPQEVSVQVDSLNNEALDSFTTLIDDALNTVGLKRGGHIRMGFTDEEQSDGWYIEEM